jgi:hypothetical protein
MGRFLAEAQFPQIYPQVGVIDAGTRVNFNGLFESFHRLLMFL